MNRRVHLRIRGQVQGVSYRASARFEALRLGLTGWVRNLPAGDVEAIAEGSDAQLSAFVAWCEQGPPSARVRGVERREAAATGEFTSFEVHR